MEGQKCSGGCSPLLCRGVSRGPQVNSRSCPCMGPAVCASPALRPALPAKGWRQNGDAGTWGGMTAPLLSSLRRQVRGQGASGGE